MTLALLFMVACQEKNDSTEATDTATENENHDNSDSGSSEIDCASRSVDTCLDDSSCTHLYGYPIRDDGEGEDCVDWDGESVPHACIAIDAPCEPSIEFAAPADQTDDCWAFASGCTPAGWAECPWVYECN